jgi:hypothetical protein
MMGSSPFDPEETRPFGQALCAPTNRFPNHRSPVPLIKSQIPFRLRLLRSSGSKKKEPKLVGLDGMKIKCETVELLSWVREARDMVQ